MSEIRRLVFGATILLAMTACQASQDISSSKITEVSLIRTERGWRTSEALTTFYSFQLVDVRGDLPVVVDLESTHGGLLDYDIVFIGENHRHPGNHFAQAMIYERLLASEPKIILSLEQFERDTQGTVDAYLAGEVGEWSLRYFGRAWDNYESSYRPLVEMARERGLPVIAANAPKDAVVCTGREGLQVLENLPVGRRDQVADSFHIPEEGAYFEKYTGQMRHGSARAKADQIGQKKLSQRALNSYHAQVVRDDTMAESIHRAMEANPGHKLVHLNGHFHSEAGLGTVERVKLRRDSEIAVIQPVMVADPAKPAFDDADMNSGEYLLLIYPLPKQVKTDENRKVWRQTVFKRSDTDCTFGAGEE